MLQGKKILLGVSGSIAAYKVATLTRLLVKEGADVKIVMTPSACNFITPLTLSTLSKHEVVVDLSDNNSWNNHVMLGRWADVMVIAPASANTIAKMAQGLCDNLLMATYLSATCPVLFAPAMDEDMWHHAATKANVERLLSFGHRQLPVATGELASGLYGEGRMSEPEAIVSYLHQHFAESGAAAALPLAGKMALVTAGPTVEPIDPVRFISNRSSGKMGIAIAEELAAAGATVKLVLGPTHLTARGEGITTIPVETAAEMFNSCIANYPLADIVVMAAAVADYRPKNVVDKKIKKTEAEMNIELEKTHDILRTLGNNKSADQLLVGFSLETNNEKEYALKKLFDKNLDMIVMNSLNDEGAGFNYDTNKVTLFDKNGGERSLPLQSKQEVAKDIVAAIIALQHE
ncbi:bifunctional phosphopantothenoylcysteine decarboxylase/phosphopantothenate--cysteine ligase CoaBC [Chitinophaga pendula]|uniref:bifunctional phosphopantothenoylcysteine decarboxylase/phosphopantothenate--cysteine ligase CoaBC n=1 Tax=Chitinophaga TaxID=79328 RepID=UPI000BAFBCCD|nr:MULTISPECIES: bifunctional phosphopantothenoylcysteine decarboxylase/phosphopantothenate--cysteine ligase CoaBC [Chitinophaga]ASZ15160.1 bifunctional phosphopantothenoylcysteine decarboxylase/phosphopantothenate--cysteine ligase CoaBC [Chitinophaga sp. MD30]UCJ07637.1 bifunctional phosphopantothenoylcysteine decarboxylase/phosphopantothenate--cysteine ligase CoaBC [Chitinophaga pendula]